MRSRAFPISVHGTLAKEHFQRQNCTCRFYCCPPSLYTSVTILLLQPLYSTTFNSQNKYRPITDHENIDAVCVHSTCIILGFCFFVSQQRRDKRPAWKLKRKCVSYSTGLQKIVDDGTVMTRNSSSIRNPKPRNKEKQIHMRLSIKSIEFDKNMEGKKLNVNKQWARQQYKII